MARTSASWERLTDDEKQEDPRFRQEVLRRWRDEDYLGIVEDIHFDGAERMYEVVYRRSMREYLSATALQPLLEAAAAASATTPPWASEEGTAPTPLRRWEFFDIRRKLVTFLTQLSFENFDQVDQKPAGIDWPSEATLPNYFPSLDVQLSMLAAPLLDDARASAYQSFSSTNVSTAWHVLLRARGLTLDDWKALAGELVEPLDMSCRYHIVSADPSETRSTKSSWLPYSVVLLVQEPVPHRREDLPGTVHRFGVLHRMKNGGFVVQTFDLVEKACPLCVAPHSENRRVASCGCHRTVVHVACAAAQYTRLSCWYCKEAIWGAEPRSAYDPSELTQWSMFIMDSFISPIRQAEVIQGPADHCPPFWAKEISGSPYAKDFDPSVRLPPFVPGPRGRRSRGPLAPASELAAQDTPTALCLRGLNSSQRQACTQALELENGVVLVQGPPGTGKTKTITSLIFACAANGARVLTCGPTNVAACEIAKRSWDMAEDKNLNFDLQVAELCIVASEDRVGINLEHPLSDIMLDHRKKRVKRAAKATLRELVPAMHDVLDRPRATFQDWRKFSLQHPDEVTTWPHAARLMQTRTTARELVSLEKSGRPLPQALAKEDVPHDTDEECRNFLVKLMEAVEDILHWQLEHLRKSVPQLLRFPEDWQPPGMTRGTPRTQDANAIFILERVVNLQRSMKQFHSTVKAIRTAIQRGSMGQVADGARSTWQQIPAAEQLKFDLVAACDASGQIVGSNSEWLRHMILAGVKVIFSTTTVAGRNMVWQQHIPNVIVDEACQARELEGMVVMRSHVQRLILVGDPEQLPSTVFSMKAKDMHFNRSLFERLVDIGQPKHTLARQYRMLPAIAEFPNITFYRGEVVDDEVVKRSIQDYVNAADKNWNFDTPVRLYDTSGVRAPEVFDANQSYSNPYEADLVVKLLVQFFRVNDSDKKLTVGIISPYKGQVKLIEDLIKGVSSTVQSRKLQSRVKLIKTVDGFQGNEQDIIVISTVRSNDNGNIGFVKDHRRLNVAITRARFRLWVIGNMQTLARGDEVWKQFIDFYKWRKCLQAIPTATTDLERRVDQVVATKKSQKVVVPTPAPPSADAGASSSSKTSRAVASHRPIVGPEQPTYVASAVRRALSSKDGQRWDSHFMQQLVNTISGFSKAEQRAAAVKKISQLLEGQSRVWPTQTRYFGQKIPLWNLAVEELQITNTAVLVYWIELHPNPSAPNQVTQTVILNNIVPGDDRAKAKDRAGEFLRTFSDEYLERAMARSKNDTGMVVPLTWEANFPQRRSCEGAEVLEPDTTRDSLPVALQKRYVMGQTELDFLVKESLKSVQLPYRLDDDEERAYHKIMHEVVFLLGRSGSGKTSVLVHALFRASCEEFQRRVGQAEDEDQTVLLLLVTRSPVLADSIRKLFAQMQAGPQGCAAGGESNMSDITGIELGVVREEERKQFRPPPASLQSSVFPIQDSPVITNWNALLRMLDNSVKGEPFFRPLKSKQSRTAEALNRARRRDGGVLLVEDRFEQPEEGGGLFDQDRDYLSYEEFEQCMGGKLMGQYLDKNKGDTLFGAFREFLTVIAGSPRAARAKDGALSREEYVSGRDASGKSVPELRESAYRGSEATRGRIYGAFEAYRAWKKSEHRFDCTDAARHILRRAEREGMKDPVRQFSGVLIDEVQDLLPVELLLLKLVSQREQGFVFAGDTAQTISKGVEFRFESIRRLFFEEFLGGRVAEVEKVEFEYNVCDMCQNPIKKGGFEFLCHGKYHIWRVCGDSNSSCYAKLEAMSRKLKQGCTKGLKNKLEHCSGFNEKLPCPKPKPNAGGSSCGLAMTRNTIAPIPDDERVETPQSAVRPAAVWTEVPDINHLTHNHRSTHGILELASAILDIITGLFPDKIDKLPREKSRVKSSSPPQILTGMAWERAQEIIFASKTPQAAPDSDATAGTTGAVLEFGAKQVVLVWSEAKKVEMQEKLPQSLVMTVQDCKGLEFFDVLMLDPFSDMAKDTSESQATQLWNLVFGFMETKEMEVSALDKKRVVPFDVDKHGLLCAWLKTLYVGITRARKRAWILESQDFGSSVVSYLSGLGVAEVYRPGDERSATLQQGFANTSDAQTWLEQGQELFKHGSLGQAVKCFTNVETLGLAQGRPWKLLAEAQEAVQPQNAQHEKGARAYVQLADWLEESLSSSQPAMRIRQQLAKELPLEHDDFVSSSARQRAAEAFLEVKNLEEASRQFERAGRILLKAAEDLQLAAQKFLEERGQEAAAHRATEGAAEKSSEASSCFREAAESAEELKLQNERPGKMWILAGEDTRALKSFARANAWSAFVDFAVQLSRKGENQQITGPALEAVVQATRDLAKLIRKKPQDISLMVSLKKCIHILPEDEQDTCLEDVGLPDLRLEVLHSRKQYQECAAIALEMRDWAKARAFYSEAKDTKMVTRLVLLQRLWELTGGGLMPKLAELDQTLSEKKSGGLFKKEDLREFERIKAEGKGKQDSQKDMSLCRAMQRLNDAFSLPASQRFGPFVETLTECEKHMDAFPGYALRIGSLAVLAMGRDFRLNPRSDTRRMHFDAIWTGFGVCRERLRAMRNDKSGAHRTRAMKLREEWLLAEQPESIRPRFLLLTSCQPQSGAEGQKIGGKELRTLALHWSHVLEASLCWVCLEVCQAFATSLLPCWSLASGHKCPTRDCPYAHEKPKQELVTLVASRMMDAASEGSKVLKSKDLQNAIAMLGTMAMEALGGSELWKKRSELPERSIHFLITRLKALVPDSPSRALDAQLPDDAVALFTQEAARSQLNALSARKRPPDLHEVVSVLSLLPFAGDKRRDLELQLLKLARMDKQAANPVFLLADTIVASVGAKKDVKDGGKAFDFFLADCKVMYQMWELWKDAKGRQRNFYAIKPSSVFHLLERVVVWASVLVTQFNNTLLPQSYLHAHLTGAEELLQDVATVGADVPSEWRDAAMTALRYVVEFVVDFLYWDHSLYEWLDKTKASYGEFVLRLYVLVLAASANDKEARRFAFSHWNYKLKLDKKLDIFKKVREEEGTGLPLGLQRLMCFTLGRHAWINWVMPWAQDVLAKLGDPYVRLFRQGGQRPNEVARILHKYTPFDMPRLQKLDAQKVEKRDGKSGLLGPLPKVDFSRLRVIRAVTKEGVYKDVTVNFRVKARAQPEARAVEADDAEEEVEGTAEEPAPAAPEAEETVPEAEAAEGEPAGAEGMDYNFRAAKAPRLDESVRKEAFLNSQMKRLMDSTFKAWRSWKEDKEKSKRSREEARQKRLQQVEEGKDEEVDADEWDAEERRLRSRASELCVQLLERSTMGAPNVLIGDLEMWIKHCLRVRSKHRERWKKKERSTFEQESETLTSNFDEVLEGLSGEDDFPSRCIDMGSYVMESLGEAATLDTETLTCQLRVCAATLLLEVLVEVAKDEELEAKPIIEHLHSLLATTTFEPVPERKRSCVSDADKAVSSAENPVPEAPTPAQPSPAADDVEEMDEEIEPLSAHEKASDPLMGVTITKKIDQEVFHGTVEDIEVGKTSRDRLYRIRYDDNEMEHMVESEVMASLASREASEHPTDTGAAQAGAHWEVASDEKVAPQAEDEEEKKEPASQEEEKMPEASEEVPGEEEQPEPDSARAAEESLDVARKEGQVDGTDETEPLVVQELAEPSTPPKTPTVTVTVEAEGVDGRNELRFTMRMETPLGKMMKAWCGHHRLPLNEASFLLGKRALKSEDTLRSLGCGTEGVVFRAVPTGQVEQLQEAGLEPGQEAAPAAMPTEVSTPRATGEPRTPTAAPEPGQAAAPAAVPTEATSPGSEEKRQAKAARHAAKRQQKREEKSTPSADQGVPKDEPPEWHEKEQKLRKKVQELCRIAHTEVGKFKDPEDVAADKGPGKIFNSLIQALRSWYDHSIDRYDRDECRWNRSVQKSYDKEMNTFSDFAEAVESDPECVLYKDASIKDILNRAKNPQKFSSPLLMNHFDLEMASVLTEVLQSWQEEAQKTWNNTLEAAQDMILKAEGEQAEKIAQRPISGYVSYLKEYIKQTAEVVARVSWVARTEEQGEAEAQTDACADAEEVQASSTPEDVDQAKTAKGAPGDHAEPEEDHPPPYEEEAQAAEAAAEEDAGGAAQADPAVSQPGIVAGEPDVQKCKDCQEPVPKNLMKKHKKKECPARIVECILCKMRMTQRVYQAHMDLECENVEATCPKCNESYLRGQYTLHQEEDCPARPTRCRHKALGCTWAGEYRYLADHLDTCIFEVPPEPPAPPPQPKPASKPAAPKSVAAPKPSVPKPGAPGPIGAGPIGAKPSTPKPAAKMGFPRTQDTNAMAAAAAAAESESIPWPPGQRKQAAEFAAKWGLTSNEVQFRMESLTPAQRNMVMERFYNPPGSVPWGRFVKFIESCEVGGWKYIEKWEANLQARAAHQAPPMPPPPPPTAPDLRHVQLHDPPAMPPPPLPKAAPRPAVWLAPQPQAAEVDCVPVPQVFKAPPASFQPFSTSQDTPVKEANSSPKAWLDAVQQAPLPQKAPPTSPSARTQAPHAERTSVSFRDDFGMAASATPMKAPPIPQDQLTGQAPAKKPPPRVPPPKRPPTQSQDLDPSAAAIPQKAPPIMKASGQVAEESQVLPKVPPKMPTSQDASSAAAPIRQKAPPAVPAYPAAEDDNRPTKAPPAALLRAPAAAGVAGTVPAKAPTASSPVPQALPPSARLADPATEIEDNRPTKAPPVGVSRVVQPKIPAAPPPKAADFTASAASLVHPVPSVPAKKPPPPVPTEETESGVGSTIRVPRWNRHRAPNPN